MKRYTRLLFGFGFLVTILGHPLRGQQPGPALFVMDADGKNMTQLPAPPEFDAQGSPVWSTDGKKIAYDAWRATLGESFRDCHIFVSNADGSNPQDLGDGAMPSFSRDGSRIAFSRYAANQGVWTMSADGSEKKRLDADGWGARWSPDGQFIAYTANAGSGNVVVYDVKNETRRRIFDASQTKRYNFIYWSFCFSPDSKMVCFKGLRDNAEEPLEVAIASVEGDADKFRVVLAGATDNKFSWHPDGKSILFCVREPTKKLFQLAAMPLDKSEPELVNGQPFDRVNTGPDWHPNGKKIIFASREIRQK